jgi:hypothetical protein
MSTLTPTHTTGEKTAMTAQTGPRSAAVNLINEALARARTRSPQRAEARRPARRVAIDARREEARTLGHRS